MIGIDDQLPLALGQTVLCDELAAGVVDAELDGTDPYADATPDEAGWHGVEVPENGYGAVLGDRPLLDASREEFLLGDGFQERSLHEPPIVGPLARCLVDPEVACLELFVHEPAVNLAIHVLHRREGFATGKEVPLEVREPVFDLPLRRGVPREVHPKSVVLSERLESVVDQRPVADAGAGDRRHVIVDPDRRYPPEEAEGRGMSVQEGVLPFIQERLQVLVPTPAEDHREEVDHQAARSHQDAVRGPVDLGALSWVRFESAERPPFAKGSDRPDVLADRRPASRVSLLLQPLEDDGFGQFPGLVLLDHLTDPVAKGVQETWLRRLRPRLAPFEDGLHGLAGELQVAGDPAVPAPHRRQLPHGEPRVLGNHDGVLHCQTDRGTRPPEGRVSPRPKPRA